ncbi:MAG: aspartate/glutamate racemase family protein [Acetobacteraceae bacterium]
MPGRILFLNPNSSVRCGEGIAAALAPFAGACGAVLEVRTLADGPPAILSWRDWHDAVPPLLAAIREEEGRTDLFVIACASDPGLEAAREATARPVIGIFSAAVAHALTFGDRFGVIAIATASIARHALALRRMGVERCLAGEIALDVGMGTLLEDRSVAARMARAASDLVAAGARTVILGCAGMARHRAAVEEAARVPVIEPCQAAAGIALARLASAQTIGGSTAPT